jgi:predicted acetyltransferase
VSFRVTPCADLEEFGQAVFAIGQYFALDPTSERMERFSKNLPIERMHAARENGAIVGGAGAFPFEMTVPGGTVPTAGVTVVGTYPTHRRRGVLRAMMRVQLDDVHERGEPMALLWSSEETIYGRFGYGMASLAGEIELAREYSAFVRPLEREGKIRLLDADEALQLFPRVWNAVRRRIPGMLGRSRNWWELRILFEPPGGGGEGGPKRFVVLERDGKPEGYAVYRHKPKWENGVSNS